MYLAAVSFYSGTIPGSIYVSSNRGSDWSLTSAPGAAWYSIASDSTGSYLAAVQQYISGSTPGYIYVSTSRGADWSLTSAPAAYWISITSDSTGTYLAAVQGVPGGPGSILV